NLPSYINRSKQVETVLGQTFGEPVFKVLNPLIELVDLLNWPRQLKVRPGFCDRPRRLAKRCDNGYFRFPHLEHEEQQAENNDQQQADYQGEWIAFHFYYFFGGGTFKLRMSSRILSCRSNWRTSTVLVVSKMYLRALAVARAKLCR